jgi:polyisoprenoid-binding protein YceI
MKKILAILSVLTLFLLSSAFVVTTNWNIDKDFSIKFNCPKGEAIFTGFTGKIVFDSKNLTESSMDVEIDASTINTGNTIKDAHAKGEDWLDVNRYPKIKFKSTSFKILMDSLYEVGGALEMHGVTKAVTIPFVFNQFKGKSEFKGKFKIDRKDFGVNGNFMASSMSGVTNIEISVPVHQ